MPRFHLPLLAVLGLSLALARAEAQTQPAPVRDTTRAATPKRETPQPLVIGSPTVDFAWTSSNPVFRQTIPLSAADTLGDTVTVQLLPLRGPRGELARVKAWFGNDTTATRAVVGRLGGTLLHIRADSGSAGQYEGGFVLVTPRTRTSKGFSVTWTRRGTGVAVDGAGASAATLGLFGGGRIKVPLTLVDTSGVATTIVLPSLQSLQHMGGTDTALQVDYGDVEVQDDQGKKLSGNLALPADGDRRLRLVVPGIREAGRYTGKVRIAGVDAEPTVVSVSVYVRYGAWLAVLLIGAGIAVSEIIRQYRGKERPRLVQRRRAAELLEALAATERQIAATGGTTADQAGVIRTLREKLEAIYDDPDAGAPPTDPGAGAAADAGARLVLYGARLGLLTDWVNAEREVVAVEDDAAREDLAHKLASVRAALLGGTPEEVKAAAQVAHALPAEIHAALRQRFLDQIAAFEKQVKEERAAHPTNDPFLASMDAEVQQRLADAAAAARSGNLARAAAGYDEARTAFADLLARELQLRLGQPAPVWLEPAERWADLKRDVQGALSLVSTGRTPEARILAFQGAHGLYLREMGSALIAAMDAKLARTPNLTDEKKTALAALRAQAELTLARVAARDLHGAAAAFAAADRGYRDLLPQLVAAGGPMGGAGATAIAPSPLGELAAFAGVPRLLARGPVVLAQATPVRRLTAAQLGAHIARRDVHISILVAIAALVLGISLLWAGKLVWGSAGDMLAAFLWGLGLHQAGTSTARGTLGLLDQINKEA
jgi:hypothetical protein